MLWLVSLKTKKWIWKIKIKYLSVWSTIIVYIFLLCISLCYKFWRIFHIDNLRNASNLHMRATLEGTSSSSPNSKEPDQNWVGVVELARRRVRYGTVQEPGVRFNLYVEPELDPGVDSNWETRHRCKICTGDKFLAHSSANVEMFGWM
jgi:hypothetical protein